MPPMLIGRPYFYNCIDCEKQLIVEGNVEETERLRLSGVCDDCLQSRLQRIFKKLKLIHRVPVYLADVRRN